MGGAEKGPPFSTEKGSPAIVEWRGRFFINMGRPGFNSRTNNRFGYDSRDLAQAVIDGKRSRFS